MKCTGAHENDLTSRGYSCVQLVVVLAGASGQPLLQELRRVLQALEHQFAVARLRRLDLLLRIFWLGLLHDGLRRALRLDALVAPCEAKRRLIDLAEGGKVILMRPCLLHSGFSMQNSTGGGGGG